MKLTVLTCADLDCTCYVCGNPLVHHVRQPVLTSWFWTLGPLCRACLTSGVHGAAVRARQRAQIFELAAEFCKERDKPSRLLRYKGRKLRRLASRMENTMDRPQWQAVKRELSASKDVPDPPPTDPAVMGRGL